MARTGVTVSGFTSAQWDKFLEPNIRNHHIKTAEEVLISAVQDGFDSAPIVVTDGKPRRDYHEVKPFGVIEFIRNPVMRDAVKWALEQLVTRSPVGPGRNGHYRDKHVVLIDGTVLSGDDDLAKLDQVKPGDRVQIVNVQPYAKKLEGFPAKKKKKLKRIRGASRKAPGGVYRPVLRLLIQRYGRSMFFDLKMVRLEIGGVEAKTAAAKNYLYPALQFYIKPPA